MAIPLIKAIVSLSRLMPLVAPPVIRAVRDRMAAPTRNGVKGNEVLDHELILVRRDLEILLSKLDLLNTGLVALQQRTRLALLLGILALLFSLLALLVAVLT